MNSTRVLCVENQPQCLVSLIELLQAAGYEVIPATSAAEALQILSEEDFEGILLEYDLPDLIGTAVRRRMKHIRPEVPVMLFTGVGSETPMLVRFFDAYLRDEKYPEWELGDS